MDPLDRFFFPSPNRYYLDSKEEGMRYFRIDEGSGLIRTTRPLDREDASWHNITVMASEVGRYPGGFPVNRMFRRGRRGTSACSHVSASLTDRLFL